MAYIRSDVVNLYRYLGLDPRRYRMAFRPSPSNPEPGAMAMTAEPAPGQPRTGRIADGNLEDYRNFELGA